MTDDNKCKCIFCGTEFVKSEDGSEKCPECGDEEYERKPDRYDPIEDEWNGN